MDKQLNVWIDAHLKDTLAERAQQEKKTLKELVEEILNRDTARHRGEMIEQQALPIISDTVQNIVRHEIHKNMARLEAEIHEYLDEEFLGIREYTRRSNDRLGALVTRAVRDGGVNRRLLYASLAKAYGPTFAQEAHENASKKASQELSSRVPARSNVEEMA